MHGVSCFDPEMPQPDAQAHLAQRLRLQCRALMPIGSSSQAPLCIKRYCRLMGDFFLQRLYLRLAL